MRIVNYRINGAIGTICQIEYKKNYLFDKKQRIAVYNDNLYCRDKPYGLFLGVFIKLHIGID